VQSVEIKCQGAMTTSVANLKDFQGDLKDLSKLNYEKLKNEILTLGFSEPVSAWKAPDGLFILNGHQRIRVLKQMASSS